MYAAHRRIGSFPQNLREPVIWTAALLFLFFADPGRPGVELCLFKLLGFSHCPGCGLGHAIHYALHLDLAASWRAHWLGVPATLGLGYTTLSSLYLFVFPSAWTRTTYS